MEIASILAEFCCGAAVRGLLGVMLAARMEIALLLGDTTAAAEVPVVALVLVEVVAARSLLSSSCALNLAGLDAVIVVPLALIVD